MASKSKIQWTDASWNPVVGCTKISPGCLNCYAEKMANRIAGKELSYFMKNTSLSGSVTQYKYMNVVENGKWNGKIHCDGIALEIPLHWRQPRMIFVCPIGDLFHPKVPFEFIDEIWWTMSVSREHFFQILTKRPKRYLEYWQHRLSKGFTDGTRENIWAGVTVCNQEEADKKIPILLQIPAAVRFVSIEPMLGAIDIRKYIVHYLKTDKLVGTTGSFKPLDWVIVGGESGPRARPMHPDWPRKVRDDCVAAGVPFFFKQWGKWAPWDFDNWDPNKYFKSRYLFEPNNCEDLKAVYPVGKKKAGRLLDGKEWAEYPKGGE